ncbi:histidine phosphatase family protein [Cytobacillus sp. Hm23]
MTSICLIRHGETDWNKKGILQGTKDTPLNSNGIIQAHQCSEFLKNSQWDILATSPLQRAKQTAQIINNNHNIPLIEVKKFMERHYGDAEGMTVKERNTKFPDQKYRDQEAWIDLQKRSMEGLYELHARFTNKKILLVSHGAVINAILATLSNGEIGTGKTVLRNTCMSHLLFHGKWSIENYNVVSHLSQYNDQESIVHF